ncbi:ccdc198 [Phodopus roborovskii]|uniref:Ccdc198 protein n=1 Tax=Phodopus roborovskii TaxID=109678 RepID=A0AAU9YZE5_PHORO|nr:ccdc198 [Phodopus roborovskii]
MGLGRSKPHPRVIKVTPLQEAEIPAAGPVFYALNRNLEEKSSYPFSRLQDQNQALEGLLPPLRETWYGRHPAVSRPIHLDIPLKHEESSIIKRHPPRRIQKLEPIDLPQVITSERLLSQQEARTKHKAKQELEKTMQLSVYTSGKRQYLHKMQMLEMNHKRQENFCSFAGNPQDEEFLEYHAGNDYCVRKTGKMEAWLREQEGQGQLFWDSSSSDSDELRDQKRPRALVRTRTERIPLYDAFYDRE